MINTLKRATKLAPLLAVAAIFATAAFAQAPSQAQRDAIKSQCRSDYMAHCSSVPPGGEASLQCLQKNMSSLSSSCQSAVRAVEAPAAPAATTAKPAEAAPAKSAAPAAATAAAPQIRRAKGRSRLPSRTADQRADFRHPQRLPLRLSEGLRGRSDRRRTGAAVPGKKQGETFGRLRKRGRRGQRRWRGGSRDCSGSGRGWRGPRCRGADRDRAAPDAAARRTVRAAVSLRRRCPLDLRRRGARRRPHPAVPRDQCRTAFARMQGCAVAVRRAVNRADGMRRRYRIGCYSPRKARMS